MGGFRLAARLAFAAGVCLLANASAHAVSLAPGDLIGVSFDGTTLVRVNATGATTTLPGSWFSLTDVGVSPGRSVFTTESVGDFPSVPNGVYEVDPETGAGTFTTSTFFINSAPLAFAPDGDLLIGKSAFYSGSFLFGSVDRIDAVTGALTSLPQTWSGLELSRIPCPGPPCHGDTVTSLVGPMNPWDLAVAPGATLFLMANFYASECHPPNCIDLFPNAIVRIEAGTGAASLLTLLDGALDAYTDLVVGPDGLLYVSKTGAGVYRVDPLTGAQSLLTPFAAGASGALLRTGSRLLVSESTGISSLDLASGARTSVFSGAAYQFRDFASVPEPGTTWLLAAMIVATLRQRRRSA